jgi:hypothetical protein
MMLNSVEVVTWSRSTFATRRDFLTLELLHWVLQFILTEPSWRTLDNELQALQTSDDSSHR